MDERGQNVPPGGPALRAKDGRTIVTTAGTKVLLSSASIPCKEVIITAELDNTGVIVVGDTTVVAALATRRGVPLSAGDSYVATIADVGRLYIDSTVSTDGVTWMALI